MEVRSVTSFDEGIVAFTTAELHFLVFSLLAIRSIACPYNLY